MSNFRILIITRSFAPDSIIASVRPTKIAKYLSLYGNDVTVIRSGNIFGKGDLANSQGLEKVHVYSYEGLNSEAEQLERREMTHDSATKQQKKSRTNNMRFRIVRNVLHLIVDPIQYFFCEGKEVEKKIMKLYSDDNLCHYDIVISTFSPLGCIQAGRKISKKEKCTWIIDYRDLMDNSILTPSLRFINRCLQKHYSKKSDACICVSEGNSKRLRKQLHENNKVYTFYNGYEDSISDPKTDDQEPIFDTKIHICYTGTMYSGRRDCKPLFSAIKKADLCQNIIIDYAGREGNEMIAQAEEYGIEGLVVDHGYLSRKETADLQRKSDIFLVLSWNTKHDQGILTGKFYEALQHRKPIIALVDGDTPESELKILIDQYHLGICYEKATKDPSEKVLQDYLEKQISRKQRGEAMEYNPDESVFSRFQYQEIARQLEQIIEKTMNN